MGLKIVQVDAFTDTLFTGNPAAVCILSAQASARGGVLRVRVDEDRVYLGGQAVTVMRGELI